jgi:hypothetical protein
MSKEKNEYHLNLNINKDDSNLNDFVYCWKEFNKRPNKLTIHSNYSTKLFKDYIDEIVVESNNFTEIIPSGDDMIINDKILSKIGDEIYLSYVIMDREIDSSFVGDLIFYYKSEKNLDYVQEIVNGISKYVIDFSEEESFNLNTISLTPNGLEIEPISIDYDFENFEIFYNNKTIKSLNKTIKKIKKSQRGLVILNGEKGVGKTSTIKYIADSIDRVVIFIPNTLIEQTINNPDFRKFLKKYTKPVLVLDDCEMIFNEYFTKSNMIVNNLLQIIDGFIFDDVTIITIFNVDDDTEIDHNLLESNNIIDVLDFEYLEVEEANELSSFIGSSKKFKTKTKLIDIINKQNVTKNKRIGF